MNCELLKSQNNSYLKTVFDFVVVFEKNSNYYYIYFDHLIGFVEAMAHFDESALRPNSSKRNYELNIGLKEHYL